MVPTREIFGNIEFGEILYIIGTIVIGILIYAIYRRTKLWRLGKPDNRFVNLNDRIRAFIKLGITEGIMHLKILGFPPRIAQRRINLENINLDTFKPQELSPGLPHFLIFAGCTVLVLGAFLDFISHYFFHFMEGNVYLGYSVVVDCFGILTLAGVLMFFIRRYGQKQPRMDNKPEDAIALTLVLLVVLSGFIAEGFRIAATEMA
jgi:nitrate reductase gamma subunit